MPTLLLHPRYDDDSQVLWAEAVRLGWQIERAGYSIPHYDVPAWRKVIEGGLAIYGGHIWAREVARQIGVGLLAPELRWLADLPTEFAGRFVGASTLADILEDDQFPLFVKSLSWPQEFASRVYASRSDLPDLDGGTPVLISDVVRFDGEFRFFCLDGKPVTWSPYSTGQYGILDTQLSRSDRRGLQACMDLLANLLPITELPRAVVVDVGVLAFGREAVVVEANPAWCSGIYQCDPTKVLEVLRACVTI